jgi:hypothetical protein
MPIRPSLLWLTCSLAAPMAVAAPRIASPQAEFDGGEMRIGQKLQHTFTIQNLGDEPLKILEVKPGCGCTTASPAKSELAPGESTTIAATLDLTGRRGMQIKPITVRSNDPAQGDFRLQLKVLSKDDFRLEPESIDLGALVAGVSTERQAVLHVLSEKLYTIREIVPSKKLGEASFVTSPDGKRHTITVRIPAQSATGTYYENFQIRTDNPDTPLLPLQVIGTVMAGLTIAPNPVLLPAVGEPVTRLVAVRGGSIKTFKVLEAKLDLPGVSVEVLPPTVFGQQIRLRNLPAGAAGADKELIIRTDAKGFEEIRVPLRVEAAPASAPS